MEKKILVTGGAGFIGSHLVDRLVKQGYKVVIYDNLEPQVHEGGKVPAYLNKDAEFIKADVRDYDQLKKVMKRVDIISHQASLVGVGQSMYDIRRYIDINIRGTATLLDVIVNEKLSIEKLIIASSMSVYGEGECFCSNCNKTIYPSLRDEMQLEKKEWETKCPECKTVLKPKGTTESKPLDTNSIYALSKKCQEEMFLMIGKTYNIPTVALRYFNVYGSRQSLSNPYTGVCAIFSSRVKNNNPPLIYEDGNQTRDFVHVSDIAIANQLAIEKQEANGQVFNVGTGRAVSINEIACAIIRLYGKKNLTPIILNKFRAGDIRHCYADISKIEQTLGFKPRVDFDEGMEELIEWGEEQKAVDRFEKASQEMINKGLIK